MLIYYIKSFIKYKEIKNNYDVYSYKIIQI
uniref:Uncharacterized protein n=1 Tax=viral metagenome TaxID=1070528 RepID=A0A6C0ENU2_9ZZZZ